MLRLFVPLCVLVAIATPAAAQQQLAARCKQLVEAFDRHGAGRSQDSDGRRNHTRIGAEIDCDDGKYQDGIAAMERLLRDRKFEVPPPPGGAS